MRYWVFTSKPEHFKMSEALIPGETLDWPTFARFKFEVGDLVFIYASSPVLQMIGKLEIEQIGLDFSEVDPRNDLRKWPKRHSRIPWMRLRVLQSAPVPFKPLQRGSLYYHTEFKPSPYPKLLHEGEIDYVMRAFNEAMTYRAELIRHPDGIDPVATSRVTRGEIFRDTALRLRGGNISGATFDRETDTLTVTATPTDSEDEPVRFTFSGIRRTRWLYEHSGDTISGIRLTLEDTYLLTRFDGADIEILAESLRID